MSSAKFSQQNGLVPALVPLADNYNAGASFDSVNMALYNHVTCIILGSDSCAGAGILTVMAGLTDGAETAAITFTYRTGGADSKLPLADVLSAPATSAALTMVEATIKSGIYVLEWDDTDMTVAGVEYQYATVVLSAAGTAGIVSGLYILSGARYQRNIMMTAIPTA